MLSFARSTLFSFLSAAVLAAQGTHPVRVTKDAERSALWGAPVQWYAGDTHEHFQACLTPVQSLADILARLEAEDLDVGSVLVWNPGEYLSFTEFACLVTGSIDPLSTPEHVLQYGVETSGLGCGKWGHLIGLGIGPEEARIATAALIHGDCSESPGLLPGCGGDGTGTLNSAAAQRFHAAPGAVCGYAHAIWPLPYHDPRGFPWHSELVASGFTTDARVLDPAQRLAVPNLVRLFFEDSLLQRTFFPLLAAVDAVLGEAQFLETIVLRDTFPLPFRIESDWQGLAYKLANLGLRISFAAGSDQDCAFIPQDELPRTYVWLDEPFDYGSWTRGLAAGRTSLGVQGLRIELRVDGTRAGEQFVVPEGSEIPLLVEVVSAEPLDEVVEILAGGEVLASAPIQGADGVWQLVFEGIQLTESTWLAARLASQRAHTGPLYALVADQPVADELAAEYWMVWCDIVTKTAIQVPHLELFGCQFMEAVTRLQRARRAFKTYRDVEGFDPAWTVARYGRSTRACRGPIAIGTMGPAKSGASVLLTCVNAPPLAEGTLYLSRRAEPAGPCADGVELYVSLDPNDLVATLPVQTTRSGFAEVLVPEVPFGTPRLYAQFVWTNPPDCPGAPCDGASPASASDALDFAVVAPVLVTLEVTPVAPSIALGTHVAFSATGLFADGTKRDLTAAVLWSSSAENVATVANAPGMAGLASAVGEGTAEIAALDPASGVQGATPLTVTAATLVALEVAPVDPAIALGTEQAFTATGTYSDATKQDLTATVFWSSTFPSVATVENVPGDAGRAHGLAVGTTDIVATAPGGLEAETRLTVTPAVLVRIEVTPLQPAIALGTSIAFAATGVFSDGTAQHLTELVTWSSTQPIVALVGNGPFDAGLATSVTVGTTQIRAAHGATGLVGETRLDVTPAALVSLALEPAVASVPVGQERAFLARGTFTDDTTQVLTSAVTWSSADPAIATVGNAPGIHGVAQGHAAGATTITATDPLSGLAASAPLTVTPALVALEVLPAETFVFVGETRAFTARGTYDDGSTADLTALVGWSSSHPALATIANSPGDAGVATGIATGLLTITASDAATGIAATASLRVILRL